MDIWIRLARQDSCNLQNLPKSETSQDEVVHMLQELPVGSRWNVGAYLCCQVGYCQLELLSGSGTSHIASLGHLAESTIEPSCSSSDIPAHPLNVTSALNQLRETKYINNSCKNKNHKII